MTEDMMRQLRILEIERRPEACLGCGHEHSCSVHGCAVINDAATELADKDAEIASLKSENERIRQNSVSKEAYQMMCEERDAAVNDLSLTNTRKFNNPCEICKHNGEKCEPVDLQSVCYKWEWRGVQKGKE